MLTSPVPGWPWLRRGILICSNTASPQATTPEVSLFTRCRDGQPHCLVASPQMFKHYEPSPEHGYCPEILSRAKLGHNQSVPRARGPGHKASFDSRALYLTGCENSTYTLQQLLIWHTLGSTNAGTIYEGYSCPYYTAYPSYQNFQSFLVDHQPYCLLRRIRTSKT